MKTTLSQERYGDSLEVLLTFSPLVKSSSYRISAGYLFGYGMIAPWIIQKIKDLEEEKKRKHDEEQPRVYIDDDYPLEPMPEEKDEKDSDRGVVIIDLMNPED